MKVELLDYTADPLFNISTGARTSCRSEDKDELKNREGFVKNLIRLDHTPVEFGWSFWKISGISRACADQIRTYRLASHCMESMRYVDIEQNEFVYPVKALSSDDSCIDFVDTCRKFYKKLVENGVPKEDARYFMPMGMSTTLKMACNFRELRHILKQRLDPHAQWEVRAVALEMLEICREKWPWLVEDIIKDL